MDGGPPPSKAAMVPRAYLETVLLIPPQSPLSVDTGTTRLCSTSTAASSLGASGLLGVMYEDALRRAYHVRKCES